MLPPFLLSFHFSSQSLFRISKLLPVVVLIFANKDNAWHYGCYGIASESDAHEVRHPQHTKKGDGSLRKRKERRIAQARFGKCKMGDQVLRAPPQEAELRRPQAGGAGAPAAGLAL